MPSCWLSWDRDFFTRSAVRRAPPLAYQHSLMIFAITRRACRQEETDAITGIIIMLYTFLNFPLHLLHTRTERMTAKTTELYQPYIAITNHLIICIGESWEIFVCVHMHWNSVCFMNQEVTGNFSAQVIWLLNLLIKEPLPPVSILWLYNTFITLPYNISICLTTKSHVKETL